MPPRARNSTGYFGVRKRPSGFFGAEITAGRERVWLGTFPSAEEAARAYDAQAWRFGRPLEALNFPENPDRATAEFLAPKPRLQTQQERREHARIVRRLDEAEAAEQARMHAERHPEDLQAEVNYCVEREAERTAIRRSEREKRRVDLAERKMRKRFVEAELVNPNSTIDKNSDIWFNLNLTTDEEVSDDTDEESDFDFDAAFP